ncbi:MAG: class I SAM-dependent methyltransferase [Micavibrio aeruginosavorus]|uniref:Class I SAM-dependent methyltransferase n=1 Tax=Micavibrio aeruginosavorus TaxID=349221 RepID=A0A7T5R2F4_9BACT|nr:MAG: class I SAM-dependent methyltransferase [Micavibrio aeruginosavorus]
MSKTSLSQPSSASLSQEGLHALIHRELETEQKTNPMSYMKFANAKGRPYQSYERIGFEGLRWSVEKRIREYGLERYFQPESVVLDIGSNYGFFVTEFALHVKAAHGVEPVPELCRIGEYTADYLGVRDKVRFFAQKFEDFQAPCLYDTVFTLASFFTSDKNQRSSAELFFGKIRDILKPGGQLFYESTSFQYRPEQEDYQHYVHALEAARVLEELFTVDDRYEAPSGPENHRLFMRCRKV